MTATEQAFDLASERGALDAMTMKALKRRYRQVSGHDSRTRNRQYLVRRILWLLQAAAHGGLSEEALARAAELANGEPEGAAVRATPPRVRVLGVVAPNADETRDERLPRPGHAIVRRYVNCCLGRDAAGHGALDGLRVPSLRQGRAVRLPVGHRQGAKMKCWRLAHQRLPILQAGEGGRMINPRRWGLAKASAASPGDRAIPLAVRIQVDTMRA